MKQLTLMLLVPDRARADVMLNEERVYYRFATESTVEDGDVPGLKERFTAVSARILDALKPRDGESPIDPESLSVKMFVDNAVKKIEQPTEESIGRLVGELVAIDDGFGFLRGFVG